MNFHKNYDACRKHMQQPTTENDKRLKRVNMLPNKK